MLLSYARSSLSILCISPVNIPNKSYGLFKGTKFAEIFDITSAYIKVNCGHCSECIRSKQLQIVQRLQMEAKKNYLFFATLTYNQSMIPELVTSTGFSIKYADWRDLQLAFMRIRNNNAFTRPFRYFAVSERGKKKGRPHFHAIILIPKFPDDNEFTPVNLEKVLYQALFKEWRRKVGGSKRSPIYEPLCTFQKKFINGRLYYNYDLHYVVPSPEDNGSDVAFYVTKYLLKPSDKETRLQQALHLNLPSDEYESVWKVVKSRCDSSLYLGLNGSRSQKADPDLVEYLSRCVSLSEDFPKFFDYKGNSFPLSRYYKKIPSVFTLDDALRLNKHQDLDKSYSQLLKAVSDYEKISQTIADRGDFDSFADVFD